MATQKKTTKKKASGKSTSSKAKSTKKSQPIPESQPLLTPRIRAIILGALSLFFVILIFVQSVNLWSTVRSALFGSIWLCNISCSRLSYVYGNYYGQGKANTAF